MNSTLKNLAFGMIAAGVFTTLLACGAPTVRADGLPLTVTIGTVTVTPGETGVVVDGDIVNTSSGVVDSDVASENVPFAVSGSIDDSGFYNNTPYPFAAGQDSGVVALFTFDVSPTAAPGDYVNDGTFTILQIDLNSPTGFDVVGLGAFTVDVVGGTVPAPEPSSLLSLLLGFGAIVLAFRRRRQPVKVPPF
jgi:PEP-CTERM motif